MKPTIAHRTAQRKTLNSWRRWGLAFPPLAAAGLVGATIAHPAWNEPLFAKTAYYVLFALVLIYAGVRLFEIRVETVRWWAREHAPGLVVTGVIAIIVVLAIQPAFRVLADEANLVGTSKQLYFQRSATFPVTGKWYDETYWTIESATDRRPALYPFLVSLLHVVRGYHVEHAFYVNVVVFVVLVFASYRLAKSLGGETFGVVAALLVGAHPNVLIAARSAGFDLLAATLLTVVVQSFVEASRRPSAHRTVVVFLNLLLLANVRYEGWALLVIGIALLVATGVMTLSRLGGYRWVYSIGPLLLLPRYWQTVAKAGDQEQPLSASLFGLDHFWSNWDEYLDLLRTPLRTDAPHAPLIMLLAIGGLGLLFMQGFDLAQRRAVSRHGARVSVFLLALIGAQIVLCFSYFWGHPLHPASARIFVWLDVTTSFVAAWFLTSLGRRLPVLVVALGRRSAAPIPVLAASALFAMSVPAAHEARFIKTLSLTRQMAVVWRYFANLGTQRILILSDRPGLYTIRDYGSFSVDHPPAELRSELSRHLFDDIYIVQEVDLSTHRPLEKFDPWPTVPTETVYEFQNTTTTSVRIVRVVHASSSDRTHRRATETSISRGRSARPNVFAGRAR